MGSSSSSVTGTISPHYVLLAGSKKSRVGYRLNRPFSSIPLRLATPDRAIRCRQADSNERGSGASSERSRGGEQAGDKRKRVGVLRDRLFRPFVVFRRQSSKPVGGVNNALCRFD